MKIQVVGKAHFEGKSSKTGRDYNFNQIHYLGTVRGVEGKAAVTLALDPRLISYDSIAIGQTYDIDFDNRGNAVEIVAVK